MGAAGVWAAAEGAEGEGEGGVMDVCKRRDRKEGGKLTGGEMRSRKVGAVMGRGREEGKHLKQITQVKDPQRWLVAHIRRVVL